MFFYLYLFIDPPKAWNSIKASKAGSVWFLQLLSLIALATIVEGAGLAHNGKWQPRFQSYRRFSPAWVLAFELVQAAVFLAMVAVSAWLTHTVLETLSGRRPFFQTFKLVAYGYTPFLLAHCLGVSARANSWLLWGVGMLATAWILYHGVPVILEPHPPQAFGQYLFTVVVLVLASGMVQTLTALYLSGQIDLQHSALKHHWPQLVDWLSP